MDRSNSDLMSRIRGRIVVGMLFVPLCNAAEGQKAARDLTEASLEDLMNIEVTTVSKKLQKLAQAPAAVYVITHEDIRRSGAANIPDLLRMVPGVQVGQIQGDSWAVGVRGFNEQYSNKLLVLVDGRSVYSPNFSGVFWDQQDTVLEDIERIEVVRGPGATLWGDNAVNGVINIITKTAAETQGALVTSGAGDQDRSLGAFRYGDRLGNAGHYRAFVKYLHGGELWNGTGAPALQGVRTLSTGFRADLTLSSRDSLTLEGGVLRSRANSEFPFVRLTQPFAFTEQGTGQSRDENVSLNWTHSHSARSQTALRVSFDRSERSNPAITEGYSTADVDFQHHLALSGSNDLVWGLGFRDSASHSSSGFLIAFLPAHRNDPLLSGFVQDQWTLPGNHFAVILGSKFERNNFTGVEVQPGARLLWTPDSRHAAWMAVSRAVRTPSYVDRGLRVNAAVFPGPGGAPSVVRISGNPSFGSENMLAYELGYRLQAERRFSVDLAGFYNIYQHLGTYEPEKPYFELDPVPAHLVIPSVHSNQMKGKTFGLEVAAAWNVTERWRLLPSYTWLGLDMRLDPASRDTTSLADEGKSPHNQVQLRSNLDLSRKLQLDASVFHTGALDAISIPAYTRLDVRLGYRPKSNFEISLAGQNLQRGRHEEFVPLGGYVRSTVGRSLMVKLTWGM